MSFKAIAMGASLVAAVVLPESVAWSAGSVLESSLKPTDAMWEEHPGRKIPDDLSFLNEKGELTRWNALVDGRPTILSLAYYRCPNLCTLVLNGLADLLRSANGKPGRDFNIVSISIDPAETPALAMMKKRTYLARLGVADENSPIWHFLTGDARMIHSITDSVGFHYAFDPLSREFAHPSGLVVLSSSGKIVDYLPGIRFDPRRLEGALSEARSGSWVPTHLADLNDFFLTCLHYDPATARNSASVLRGIRFAAVAFISIVLIISGFAAGHAVRKRKEGLI